MFSLSFFAHVTLPLNTRLSIFLLQVNSLIPKHYLPTVIRLCGKLEMLDRILPKLKATDHRVCNTFCLFKNFYNFHALVLQYSSFGYIVTGCKLPLSRFFSFPQ